jgi:hypothetical protein
MDLGGTSAVLSVMPITPPRGDNNHNVAVTAKIRQDLAVIQYYEIESDRVVDLD